MRTPQVFWATPGSPAWDWKSKWWEKAVSQNQHWASPANFLSCPRRPGIRSMNPSLWPTKLLGAGPAPLTQFISFSWNPIRASYLRVSVPYLPSLFSLLPPSLPLSVCSNVIGSEGLSLTTLFRAASTPSHHWVNLFYFPHCIYHRWNLLCLFIYLCIVSLPKTRM